MAASVTVSDDARVSAERQVAGRVAAGAGGTGVGVATRAPWAIWVRARARWCCLRRVRERAVAPAPPVAPEYAWPPLPPVAAAATSTAPLVAPALAIEVPVAPAPPLNPRPRHRRRRRRWRSRSRSSCPWWLFRQRSRWRRLPAIPLPASFEPPVPPALFAVTDSATDAADRRVDVPCPRHRPCLGTAVLVVEEIPPAPPWAAAETVSEVAEVSWVDSWHSRCRRQRRCSWWGRESAAISARWRRRRRRSRLRSATGRPRCGR